MKRSPFAPLKDRDPPMAWLGREEPSERRGWTKSCHLLWKHNGLLKKYRVHELGKWVKGGTGTREEPAWICPSHWLLPMSSDCLDERTDGACAAYLDTLCWAVVFLHVCSRESWVPANVRPTTSKAHALGTVQAA